MNHDLQWVTPSASWNRLVPRGGARPGMLTAPSILSFNRDDFMEALIAHLNPPPRLDGRPAEPGDLGDFALDWESNRLRPSGAPAAWRAARPNSPVPKLFHPAHGRFYLVAASLVCRLPGLPDRAPDLTRGDRVGHVLRRVRDEREEAWIPSSEPNEGAWQPVPLDAAAPDPYGRAAPGEELRPMFPVTYRREGKARRIWAALIPVASRETYRAPQPPAPSAPGRADDDVALAEPRARVRQGLGSLRDANGLFALLPGGDSPGTEGAARAGTLASRVELARYLLVDLAELLNAWLPAVYADLGLASSALPIGTDARELRDALASIAPELRRAWEARDPKEGGPGFDPAAGLSALPFGEAVLTRIATIDPVALDAQIVKALGPARSSTPAAEALLPRFEDPDAAESRYVVRCVFRPHDCGPARPDVVGAPSVRFAMASFFDGDAPARPIRISLPVDTSVAALRKSPRNVAFVLSSGLRKQMARIGPLKDVLDGKLKGEEEISLGEICSLSIPIITICAFIVLFIFLVVLNLIFWWLPFIKICFPIPRRSE